MADIAPSQQRVFHCSHCNGKIMVPRDLPATTGPCPLCGGIITSPGPEADELIVHPHNPPVLDEAKANPTRTQRSEPVEEVIKSSPILAIIVLLAIAMVGSFIIWFVQNESKKNHKNRAAVSQSSESVLANKSNYNRIGWQKDAAFVLDKFINASTIEDKKPYILNPQETAPVMEDFYKYNTIHDTDTPAELFTISELAPSDTERGLFVMIYDQTASMGLKDFFRPLADLEVQYGIAEPNVLLSTLAMSRDYTNSQLTVLAFFKRGPNGLKLDWELFNQTKYRTLKAFTERPQLGQKKVFRCMITEDIPEKITANPRERTYRVMDPANFVDGAKVVLKIDSDIGKILSVINWRGIEGGQQITQTATLELTWAGDEASPRLEISRYICWEFLGLGGFIPANPTPTTK